MVIACARTTVNAPQTKTLTANIEKAASGGYDGTWVVSSTSPDRVGDSFSSKALQELADKTKRVVCLFNHSTDKPVGVWENFSYAAGKLKAQLRLSDTNLGKMLRQLLSDSIPIGASVGFRILDAEPNALFPLLLLVASGVRKGKGA